MANNKKVLVFDIGGTKLASAVAEIGKDKFYKIWDYQKTDTPQSRREIIAKILELVEFYRSKHNFKNIGFAVAGQINAAGDTVVYAPNIPELNNFKLVSAVSQKTGMKVFLKNDVRAFAIGEDTFGKFAGSSSALFVAVGTGIGGAIKMNGKFYFGNNNVAGEFGHMVIEKDGKECGCGRKGCWEKYAGGKGIEESYEEAYGEEKSAKDIFCDGLRGSVQDEKIVVSAGSCFAAGLANLINIFNPEVVVIGGSMFKEKGFLKLILPLVQKEVLPSAHRTKIVGSSLGDDAFLLGAAKE